jgi:cyclophilin family peptidyl-prolyl cis-trans isomerase
MGVSLLTLTACASPQPTGSGAATARVQLDTGLGRIELEIDSATAPAATAAVLAQLENRRFDGLAFDWVQPHTEIRTGPPADDRRLPSELDAVALGLDQRRIEHAGTAMETIQRELEPAYMQAAGAGTPQLRTWIAQWRKLFVPDFLIGVSREEINTALGYRYQRGYASRPLRRGSVALVPAEAGSTTLALAIVLRDLPERDGRWVVIGQISSGLEIVEQISLQARVNPKRHRPAQPVPIVHARLLSGGQFTRSTP